MITILARWTVTQENLKSVMENLDRLVAATRLEPGNLSYQPYCEPNNPLSILIYEQYQDEAAIEIHRASPHFQTLALGKIVPLLASREIHVLKNVSDH